MDLHVLPIPISPPASLSIPSLWVFPVHQPWALVSCIQPGLVICFTLHSILVSMLFGLGNFKGYWVGGLFQLFYERDRVFQLLNYWPFFGFLWLVSEVAWHLWVCHQMLMYYNEHMQVNVYWKSNLLPSWPSSVLFLPYPILLNGYVILLMIVPCPFLPGSPLSHFKADHGFFIKNNFFPSLDLSWLCY